MSNQNLGYIASMKLYVCLLIVCLTLSSCSSFNQINEKQADATIIQNHETGVYSEISASDDFLKKNESDLRVFRLQVMSLYNRALRQYPNLQGEMSIYMVIQPTGLVSNAKVSETTIIETKFNQKILKRAKLIKFSEPPKKAISVSLPVKLMPG
jgi:hypothetical protein